MKIAFIEFEYPPDTARGGIAAYTWEAARALSERGHSVEVFAGAKDRVGRFISDGVLVHRVGTAPGEFYLKAGQAFQARHLEVEFDVLEGAELTAPAREAIRLVPDIPFVVRLHGPSFKLRAMSVPATSVASRLRTLTGAVRRGRRPFWWDQAIDRIEREQVRRADVVAVTSRAVGDLVRSRWRIDPKRMILSPLPFSPNASLLEIPPGGVTRVITFAGHLCVGKGLIELVDAMRAVMRQDRAIRLKLVGHIGPSPSGEGDMRDYVLRVLREFGERVLVTGPIPRERMPEIFRETDIFVLPSHWDTFPVACLEAMAAARAIIGTTNGGMVEMLDDGNAGVLVPPFRPRLLASTIRGLAGDPARRQKLGQNARHRLLAVFDRDRTIGIQEHCYVTAIEAKKTAGSRGREIAAV